MALCKRGAIWWIDFHHNGKRIRRSCETSEKPKAQQLHDKLKADLWNIENLGTKPERSWLEAASRWLNEQGHKKSICSDILHLDWLKPILMPFVLSAITREVIDYITQKRIDTGVSNATVNRMLEVLRAILRRSERDWGWLNRAPAIRMLKEENKRIRWITKEDANKLLHRLPSHLSDLAAFSLVTGLRKANVLELEWSQIDIFRKHALIYADQSKTGKPIAVPLNNWALKILKSQFGKHDKYVFTYKGKKINQCNTKAWRRALVDCGIENFRWHDLRHTWASWHVQSGTSLQELQQLGGWSSFEMVLRYAHLSSDHLQEAADRINVTISSQSHISEEVETLEAL